MYLMVLPMKQAFRSRRPSLMKMGELVERSGLSRQTLNHYILLGLITEEARTASDRYLFGESVLHRLSRIEVMKRSRTLKQIRESLEQEATS